MKLIIFLWDFISVGVTKSKISLFQSMDSHRLTIVKKPWLSLVSLAIMAATYTLIIGNWAVNRFMSFNATLWDLGIMTQAIWNTAQGRILHESINLGFSISRLAAAHWEFIYLPLALIYRIFPSIPLLLYIQTFVLACGVFPIYKFAVKKLSSEKIALLIATAYLFYPAIHGSNLFDLHGVTFATTFLLVTFYYLDEGSQIKTIIFAFLSICCREDVSFVIFMLGLYNFFIKTPVVERSYKSALEDETLGVVNPINLQRCKHIRPPMADKQTQPRLIITKQRKIGLILITLSIVWITAFFSRGYFIGHPELVTVARITSIWDLLGEGGIHEFLKSPFEGALVLINSIFNYQSIKYIAKLILPIFGLCCLSPSVLLIILPTLLLNLLSTWPQMHQIEYHYTATITPFIFLATIKGLANLKRWLTRFPRFPSERVLLIMGMGIVLSSVISTSQFSILRFHKTWHVSKGNKLLSKKLQEIPSELSVATTARPGPHLANREELYHFPEHGSDADIILLELNRSQVEIKNLIGKQRTNKVSAMNDLTRSVFQDKTLGLRFVQDNVFCFQRGIDPQESFADYAFRDKLPQQAIKPEKIDMGNGLIFLGWMPVYISEKQAHFELYWLHNKHQTEGANLDFYLSSENWITEIPHEPIFGRMDIEQWLEGKIICDHLFINKPKNVDTTTFSIMASFSSFENNQKHRLFTFRFP